MFMHTKNNETLENAHNHRHTWIDLNIEIQQRLHQIVVDAVLARPKPHFHRGTLQKHHFCIKAGRITENDCWNIPTIRMQSFCIWYQIFSKLKFHKIFQDKTPSNH